MTETRDHFIPFRRPDVVEMCLARPGLEPELHESFRSLARILAGMFHHEFRADLDGLLGCYAPFDPDRDTERIRALSGEERASRRECLVVALRRVLERGNYVRVSDEEIERAMVTESLFRLRLSIDFDSYEECLVFRRGEAVRREEVPVLFGWRKREIDVPYYERVVLYVHFREADSFPEERRKKLPFEPGSMVVKLFSNIPKADLEMLLPNSAVRMRTIDKLVMGVPAVLGGIFVVVTKLAAVIGLVVALVLFWLGFARDRPVIDSARLVALGAGVAAFASFVVKQWLSYKNRKIRFLKILTENLYFKNLANNAAALRALVDRAESEEVKEAIVAYRFLSEEPAGLTRPELNGRVESWLVEEWHARVDFDTEDALAKLVRLGVAREEDGRYTVLPIGAALTHLDTTWNAFFDFDGALPERGALPDRGALPERGSDTAPSPGEATP